MRILYQADGFLPHAIGGVEVLSLHLLKALRARGHAVQVVTAKIGREPDGMSTFDGLPVLTVAFGKALQSRDLSALARVRRTLAETVAGFRPDVLHLNDAMPSSFFFRRSGALANLPRLLTLHTPPGLMGRDGLEHRMTLDADRIIAVSRAHGDAAIAAGVPAHKMTVITNALPTPDLAPAPSPHPAHLLCVGRTVPEKGFDVAIRALGRLRRRGSTLSMTIAGDGNARAELEALANDLAPGQVRFLGSVAPEKIPALINRATIVIVPSRWQEPFGLVALQAAQMGRPVIAGAVGGLTEVIADGETGILVPPGDDDALALEIEKLVRDPIAVARLGARARRRAGDEFSFDRFVHAYEAAYATVRTTSQVEIA